MESERMERFRHANKFSDEEKQFEARIIALLNHPDINDFCLIDAYYHDFSILPRDIQNRWGRDAYLIYGITDKGEMITKWVERWDLDSDLPIINGKVVRDQDSK